MGWEQSGCGINITTGLMVAPISSVSSDRRKSWEFHGLSGWVEIICPEVVKEGSEFFRGNGRLQHTARVKDCSLIETSHNGEFAQKEDGGTDRKWANLIQCWEQGQMLSIVTLIWKMGWGWGWLLVKVEGERCSFKGRRRIWPSQTLGSWPDSRRRILGKGEQNRMMGSKE